MRWLIVLSISLVMARDDWAKSLLTSKPDDASAHAVSGVEVQLVEEGEVQPPSPMSVDRRQREGGDGVQRLEVALRIER